MCVRTCDLDCCTATATVAEEHLLAVLCNSSQRVDLRKYGVPHDDTTLFTVDSYTATSASNLLRTIFLFRKFGCVFTKLVLADAVAVTQYRLLAGTPTRSFGECRKCESSSNRRRLPARVYCTLPSSCDMPSKFSILCFFSIFLIKSNVKSENIFHNAFLRQKRSTNSTEPADSSMSIRSTTCPSRIYYSGSLCAILYQQEGCLRDSVRVYSGNDLAFLNPSWAKEPKSAIVLSNCRLNLCYCSRDNCTTLTGEKTIGISYEKLPWLDCGQLVSLECTCGSLEGSNIGYIVGGLLMVLGVALIAGRMIWAKKKRKSFWDCSRD